MPITMDEWSALFNKWLDKVEKEWCQCLPDPDEFEKHGLRWFSRNDGECRCGVWKHHCHCGKCGKLTQIG